MARARANRAPFPHCRVLGHAWDEYNPRDGGSRGVQRLTLRCTRCTTTRHDELDRYGNVERRHYAYPDGYKTPSDERPSRAAMRLMLVKR